MGLFIESAGVTRCRRVATTQQPLGRKPSPRAPGTIHSLRANEQERSKQTTSVMSRAQKQTPKEMSGRFHRVSGGRPPPLRPSSGPFWRAIDCVRNCLRETICERKAGRGPGRATASHPRDASRRGKRERRRRRRGIRHLPDDGSPRPRAPRRGRTRPPHPRWSRAARARGTRGFVPEPCRAGRRSQASARTGGRRDDRAGRDDLRRLLLLFLLRGSRDPRERTPRHAAHELSTPHDTDRGRTRRRSSSSASAAATASSPNLSSGPRRSARSRASLPIA